MVTESSVSRDAWGSRLGFILAAVGSAVGLGNMWRFSYTAAEGGGAIFVLLYVIFVALIGIPVMTSELVIGRLSQESPAKAIRRLGGPMWAPLGWLFVFCGFGILSYYSVIAGWTIRLIVDGLRSAVPTDTGAYFTALSTGKWAIVGHLMFMGITIAIVTAGIQKGLERAALVMMPMLFFLLLFLAVWAATLSGAGEAYAFYLNPDFSQVTRAVIGSAMGQAFFSLSLGMGALMTYASYLRTKENLGREAAIVSLSDFGVAFVFPVIFSFGLQDQVGASTLGALFISLPAAFASLGKFGNLVTVAFFVMLFFGALTSAISLLEVVVTAFVDAGYQRTQAAVGTGIITALVGIPSAISLNFLGAADQLVGNFMLILGGFFTVVLIGWKLLPMADEELAQGLENETARKMWGLLIRYLAPPVLLLVLVFTVARPTWDAIVALF
ncbi:MAG: sodium-dependent transporter [Gemmatimonadales bacterium]